MSTLRRKKPTDPKPLYHNDQLLFFIDYSRTKAGLVLQSKVKASRSVTVNTVDGGGKKTGTVTKFEYDIETAMGAYEDVQEKSLYPNITTASLAFAETFTHLLK